MSARHVTQGRRAVQAGSDGESFERRWPRAQLLELREQDAADTLANIMHWCEARGVNWAEAVGRAADHYRDEGGDFHKAGQL